MYKIKIDADDVNYLKNLSEDMKNYFETIPRRKEYFVFSDEDKMIDFQGAISDAIVDKGMDHQDTVNDIGIRLYQIYDDILWQKHHQNND